MKTVKLFFWLPAFFIILSASPVLSMGQDKTPLITAVEIAGKDVMNQASHTLIKKDLDRQGRVLVQGQATGNDAALEKVEYSLDGGQSWQKAKGKENWQFYFSPQPESIYQLKLKATNINQETSAPGQFVLRLNYKPLTLNEWVQQHADKLARAYMSRNIEQYMRLISRSYQKTPKGWKRLRQAIQNDFKARQNILLRFTTNQTYDLGDKIIANLYWQMTYAGLEEPVDGYIEIHFDADNQMLVLLQDQDLYFRGEELGYDAKISIRQRGSFTATATNFVSVAIVVKDLDEVNSRSITVRYRITNPIAPNSSGTLNLQENPVQSGIFRGSKSGLSQREKISITYLDKLTSSWKTNINRSKSLTIR